MDFDGGDEFNYVTFVYPRGTVSVSSLGSFSSVVSSSKPSHPSLTLHPLLLPGLLLLWLNEFSFSTPLPLEILLNVVCFKRESQRRIGRFRRRTNRRKRI